MEFSDAHRLVIGYHGTRLSVAREIVQRLRGFEESRNPDDWLGHGTYFWEHTPQQAFRWAKQRQRSQGWREPVAVLGSMLQLGKCLDLLEPSNVAVLEGKYHEYLADRAATGMTVPRNMNHRKYLDCAVFEFAYQNLEEVLGHRIDTVRAVYVPTGSRGRVWRSSWISNDAHIQLCVRTASCILGTWIDRFENGVADERSDETAAS